jgi:cellulose synthase/poly-beta-1,6-N-acetylglucosamine synthase-like glycosyltransferase
LIIDSDTRVPEDCFVDAVSEFEASPECAIIQHSSGVMQVAHHFFENGIAHFIRSIQLSISFYCSNGTSAPFVGHNAFLRWSALQDIMFEEDGVKKIWSETHVSEDFAMSMALQLKGYTVRWATYSNDKFEEGVSLTCGDEVNRWQKYAWGVSEIIFHPFRYWITRGPFTPLFRKFLWCDLPLPSKISTLAYMFSYYAIAAAWPIALLNFVILGFTRKPPHKNDPGCID